MNSAPVSPLSGLPEQPALAGPDVEQQAYAALAAFAARFLPAPASGRVIRAWCARAAPPQVNDFIVMRVLAAAPVSTVRRAWDPDSGLLSLCQPLEVRARLDFYGQDSLDAALRAFVLLRDPVGCAFLRARGAAPLHADGPVNQTAPDETKAWLPCWSVDVSLGLHARVACPTAWFSDAELCLLPQ